MLKPSGTGWEIFDTRHDRPVALVYDSEEATIIIAYLNGHMDIASRLHEEFIARLDRSKDAPEGAR